MLDGFFAFVVLDKNTNTFYAARDPMGITCMYIGWGKDGSVWLSSEMKCLKVGAGKGERLKASGWEWQHACMPGGRGDCMHAQGGIWEGRQHACTHQGGEEATCTHASRRGRRRYAAATQAAAELTLLRPHA